MMIEKWFWEVLTIICIIWYSTITVYVSIKGTKDIKNMLKKLSKPHENK
jgi:hypothetical protein